MAVTTETINGKEYYVVPNYDCKVLDLEGNVITKCAFDKNENTCMLGYSNPDNPRLCVERSNGDSRDVVFLTRKTYPKWLGAKLDGTLGSEPGRDE